MRYAVSFMVALKQTYSIAVSFLLKWEKSKGNRNTQAFLQTSAEPAFWVHFDTLLPYLPHGSTPENKTEQRTSFLDFKTIDISASHCSLDVVESKCFVSFQNNDFYFRETQTSPHQTKTHTNIFYQQVIILYVCI